MVGTGHHKKSNIILFLLFFYLQSEGNLNSINLYITTIPIILKKKNLKNIE